MIGQYLLNKNENAIVTQSKKKKNWEPKKKTARILLWHLTALPSAALRAEDRKC